MTKCLWQTTWPRAAQPDLTGNKRLERADCEVPVSAGICTRELPTPVTMRLRGKEIWHQLPRKEALCIQEVVPSLPFSRQDVSPLHMMESTTALSLRFSAPSSDDK